MVTNLAFDDSLYHDLKSLLASPGARSPHWNPSDVLNDLGNIIPGHMIDIVLSYETCLGPGAVVVFNSKRDIIDIVHNNMHFLNDESCGKCTPCREGTEVMLEILGRLRGVEGAAGDIDALEDLAQTMALASLCGLGQEAAVPVLDSLKYFRAEYVNRIEQSLFLRSYLGEELSKSKEGER